MFLKVDSNKKVIHKTGLNPWQECTSIYQFSDSFVVAFQKIRIGLVVDSTVVFKLLEERPSCGK